MASRKQLANLRKGVEFWNRWIAENRNAVINLPEVNLSGAKLAQIRLAGADLSGADLSGVDLTGGHLDRVKLIGAKLREANLYDADLYGSNLSRTDLRGANLSHTNFIEANLSKADLSQADLLDASFRKANLTGASLWQASLRKANLTEAILCKANLAEADLSETVLNGANLSQADLTKANLRSVNIEHADLAGAEIGKTNFSSLDLSHVEGLDKVQHSSPSSISTDTLWKSQGKIPDVFLKGCGLSDADIEYARLFDPTIDNEHISEILYSIYDLRASQSIQLSPLFISYNRADSKFVDKVERRLNWHGVRFWRDIHDMKAGRMEKQIDRAIRQNPTVLLILSENASGSDWVVHEVRTARELEKDLGRDVLCPVALDDSWKSSRWPARVMEQIMEYNILDFSQWQDDSKFDRMFRKLIDGLELFYKG